MTIALTHRRVILRWSKVEGQKSKEKTYEKMLNLKPKNISKINDNTTSDWVFYVAIPLRLTDGEEKQNIG
jgi:hypothetical protein